MIKIVFAILTFFSLAKALGESSQFKIISLYEPDAYLTERFIPFTVKHSDERFANVQSASATYPCYTMLDPYRPSIVLLFCNEATNIKVSIQVRDENNQVFLLSTPLLDIKKLALISSTPSPEDTLYDSNGKKLFLSNCMSCHKNQMITKGVTPEILTAAFKGEPMRNGKTTDAMKNKGLSGFFSASELNDLVKFINEEL